MAESNGQHTGIPTREEIEREIRQNYQVFIKLSFRTEDKHKFALLHKGKLVDILETRADAHTMGQSLYKDGIYSVQEIDPPKIDLGYMSRALCSD